MDLHKDTNNFLSAIILDRHLNILEVNNVRGERAGQLPFDLSTSDIGSNYIEVIFQSKTDSSALAAASGIQAIIEGESSFFELEYPIKDRSENYRLLMRATRFGEDENLRIIITLEDITRRKPADAAFENEKAYEIFAETASDVIIRVDENGQILFINQAAERVFGYKTEEMIGRSLMMIMPEHSIKAREANVERRLETEKNYINWENTELSARHRDGHSFPIEFSFGRFPQPENSEKVSGFTLKSASLDFEEALKKFICSADAEQVKQDIKDAVNEDCPFQTEMRVINSKGETVWLEFYGNVVCSGSEFPVKIVGVTQNITERKRIEDQLRESEQNLRILADSIPQLAWMAEPDGRIFWFNQGWYDYTGKAPEDIEGLNWQSVHDPKMMPKVVARWKHSIENGKSFEMEFPLLGADGNFRWFLTRVNPLRDSQGNIVRWFGTNTDIDDSKQIEIEREEIFKREKAARHEAEEANRAKDEFLSVLSHELRTPLNSMLGWVKMLNAGMLNEEQKLHAFTVLERNIRQQNDLIEDLLDVSRIISGKMNIETEEVDFASVVETAIENIRPIADGKNISIELKTGGGQKIVGDETRLNQIVNNLLSNAVKFTPESGKISVGISQTNGTVKLNVSDSGIGIAPQFLPHIFDRFRQADSTTRRTQSGLGLGLTIVRHLTELHGGKINAFSPGAGQGSTFSVELPKNLNSEPTAKLKTAGLIKEDNYVLKDVRILLADDNCDGLLPLKMLLEIKQAVVECVDSARGALKKLAEERFHILISDIGMPDMDGYELLKNLREMNDNENSSIPAIALTAYASVQDRERALNAGFEQHLSKPIDFDQLLSSVENLINHTKNQ